METSFLNIRNTRPEDHHRDPGPMDRRKTHGTWLGGGIDPTIRKIETFKFSGRKTDGIHLRVTRGVLIFKNGVMRDRNPLIPTHDHRPKGPPL